MLGTNEGSSPNVAGIDEREPCVVFSVVIPTYNRRVQLLRCLDALARQTGPPFEVIVVDDCSSDATPEAVREWATRHEFVRIECLVNDSNTGANASRNRGVDKAAGELVAFLDSDCIPEPDWLARLQPAFDDKNVAAVTGAVSNPPPANIFELTYRGTNRVYGPRYASRLVGCNMCMRREFLLRYPFDTDLKYGCDEEGFYLRVRNAGYRQIVVHDARVLHDHHFTGRSLMRHARVGGAAAAWLVYKYHLPPRLDLLPFMLGYLLLPLLALGPWFGIASASCFVAGLAALLYNELFRKGKTIWQTTLVCPVLLVYYHVRLVGYVSAALTLRLGLRTVKRVRLDKCDVGDGDNAR